MNMTLASLHAHKTLRWSKWMGFHRIHHIVCHMKHCYVSLGNGRCIKIDFVWYRLLNVQYSYNKIDILLCWQLTHETSQLFKLWFWEIVRLAYPHVTNTIQYFIASIYAHIVLHNIYIYLPSISQGESDALVKKL